MEQEYRPEAAMHGYKTNRMKNNKRIRHSWCVLMFAKPHTGPVHYGVGTNGKQTAWGPTTGILRTRKYNFSVIIPTLCPK